MAHICGLYPGALCSAWQLSKAMQASVTWALGLQRTEDGHRVDSTGAALWVDSDIF